MISSKTALKYILFDLTKNFFFGVMVFILLLVVIQFFSMAEDIFQFNPNMDELIQVVGYISLSFLPMIIPMSLLFSILMTYSRLNMESELIALKSLGIPTRQLLVPCLILALGSFYIAAQLSFFIAPWGQKKLATTLKDMAETRLQLNIQEGRFNTQFKDVMVYSENLNHDKTKLDKLFIYNEIDQKHPIIVLANRANLAFEKTPEGSYGKVELINGHIYKYQEGSHTKVSFEKNKLKLFDPIKVVLNRKSASAMNFYELKETMKTAKPGSKLYRKTHVEFNKRWVLCLGALLFALIGFGLATIRKKRQAKSSGFVGCVTVIVVYWLILVGSESLAFSGKVNIVAALWTPSLFYLFIGLYLLRKASRV